MAHHHGRAHDGGYLVSGRKAFCSQSPAATVVATCAVLGEPGEGAEVLHFGVPLAAPGVRLEETWDTLGMRGTASHDVVLEEVFVPAGKVTGVRSYGEFGAPLMAAAVHFAPVAAATYHGIAAGAAEQAIAAVSTSTRGPVAQARVHRQVGLVDAKLRTSWWSVMGAVDDLGDDYVADPHTLATVMLAKRQAVRSAIEVVDLAMEVMGGRSFFRRAGMERAYRDVRAGTFHPLTPEATLTYAGKVARGDPD